LNEIITEDGEVITNTPLAEIDHSMARELASAEIDTLIATARRYPRSMTLASKRMVELATMDEESADEAIYSLPRGGKTLEGPSIRFAEMAAQAFGNNRVAARTTAIDRKDKYVEAEGVFLDLETNSATLARVRRRIVDSKGRLFNDDMIIMTCNAAQSIARRNAILSGIPKAVWNKAYQAARQVVIGDITTLANRRAEAIKAYQRFGITSDQIFQALEVKGEEDIGQDQYLTLRSSWKMIRDKEITIEEFLKGKSAAEPAKPSVADPFKDEEPGKQAQVEAPKEESKPAAASSESKPDKASKKALRDLGETSGGEL